MRQTVLILTILALLLAGCNSDCMERKKYLTVIKTKEQLTVRTNNANLEMTEILINNKTFGIDSMHVHEARVAVSDSILDVPVMVFADNTAGDGLPFYRYSFKLNEVPESSALEVCFMMD